MDLFRRPSPDEGVQPEAIRETNGDGNTGASAKFACQLLRTAPFWESNIRVDPLEMVLPAELDVHG